MRTLFMKIPYCLHVDIQKIISYIGIEGGFKYDVYDSGKKVYLEPVNYA